MEVKQEQINALVDVLISDMSYFSKKKNLDNSRFVGVVIFSNISVFPLTYNYEHKHLVIREWPGKLYANELFDFSGNPINNSIVKTYESF